MNPGRLHIFEYILAVAAMAIFGGTFSATKIALRGLHPAELAFVRFALATLFLAPACLRQARAMAVPSRGLQVNLAVVGFFGVSLVFLMENTALSRINASVASVIVASMPAFLAVIAVPFLGERFTAAKAGAIVLATLGIVLVSYNGDLGILERRGELFGVVLMTAVAVTEAFVSVVSKRTLRRVAPLTFTFYTNLYGTIGLLPFALRQMLASDGPRRLDGGVFASVLYLALGASVFGYYVYYHVLSRIEASLTAFFLYLIPVFGTAAGVVIFGERITPWFLAGSLMIVGGVASVQRRRIEPKPPVAPI